MSGTLTIVGLGPGSVDLMTPAARAALEAADVIVGYQTYLKLIAAIVPETPRVGSGMRAEVKRVGQAIELARNGQRVALVSSGDPGIYGMAGLALEMLREQSDVDLNVDVIPGVSVLNAGAALLGAPLMTDFAVVSLSDQLVPRADILRRVELAAQADFVLCLYNPRSRQRCEPFAPACPILRRARAPGAPVGVVRAAYREGQTVTLTTLDQLASAPVDMLSIVIVGSSRTVVHEGRMITARGYGYKYRLGG